MSSIDSGRSKLRITEDGEFGPPDEQTDRIDDIFEILRNRRRRCILRYLVEEGGEADFRDLVEVVTAWEEDIPMEEITYDQRKRVYIALHQTHVPKLEKLGIIDHDQHSGEVSLTEAIVTLRPFLELTETATEHDGTDTDAAETPGGETDEEGLPMSTTNLTLFVGVGGFVAAGLAVVGVPPFSMVPGIGYAIALSAFLVAAWFFTTDDWDLTGE